jgi:peptidoglycan/LPS O-acetylase OafA/YrhL
VKTYLPSLDGLRGVAALAVMGSHFENLSGISLHLQHAGVAVDFFFILSGFVIAQAYESRLEHGLGWRAYMILRLERLYPAILGGLFIGLIVAMAGGEELFPAMALQVLLLPVLWGPILHGGELYPLNGPLWSLFLELTANALHAAAFRRLSTARLAAIVALAAVVLVPVSLHYGGLDVGWGRRDFWGGPPRVVFGFGTGLLIHRLQGLGVSAPRAPYGLIVLGLILCLVRPFPEAGHYALTDPIIVLIVLPALVMLAVRSPPPARVMKLTLWLGALSYPLYAIHAPLLRGFETILDALPDRQQALGWTLALPVVIALATLFERALDAPIREWLRARRTAVNLMSLSTETTI